jgi:serine/threonine-protein kinase
MVRGDRLADHRVDIYTLGCVAYWLLTGRLVFHAANAIQLMYQHANAIPVPPSQLSEFEVPEALDSAILACLAKFPEERPQSAAELSGRLLGALPGAGWTEEIAHRWWDRHHLATARLEQTDSHRILTKTMEAAWEPIETPSPVASAGS